MVLRAWVIPAVLILLAAGLGVLVPAPQAAPAASQGSSISTGLDFSSCASSRAYCWGSSEFGQLGDGSR